MKVEQVNNLHEKFINAKGAILADYKGLTVSQISDLRNQLREKAIEFEIIKNTLAIRASTDTQFESIKEHFVGPTSAAFSYDDVVAPAKIMISFAKKNKNLKIKAGIIEGEAVNSNQVSDLALLPSREALLGKVLATMQAPVSNFVGVLGGIIREFVGVLDAIKEKKGGK